jgi:predicted regulator of Ras-like GTPase activity (Roadblock/LC7/MglB family)
VTDSVDTSPAFLALGERLRQRGLVEAALAVAEAGAARFPMLVEAHDLVGRVRADQGDDEGARRAWLAALECQPNHAGALKGLAFLAFRRRDHGEAERRLEAAVEAAPRDPSLRRALDRVRGARPRAPEAAVVIDDPESGVLLASADGLRLGGYLDARGDEAAAEAAAAMAAGVAREAERTARLLDLGAWRHVLMEGSAGRTAVLPMAEGVLLFSRGSATPAGRLLAAAARARDAARAWLGAAS